MATQDTSTQTDADDVQSDETWTIAAKGFDEYGSAQVLTGTRHILEDEEPLCNNPDVARQVANGDLLTEEAEYPTDDWDTCKTCGRIYMSRYGSNDETFALMAEFEAGDWVQFTTEDGETFTGRVHFGCDSDEITRRSLNIVISDEPQERWTAGVDKNMWLRVPEGGQPTADWGSMDDRDAVDVVDVQAIEAPTGNIDKRTQATLDDIKQTGGYGVKKVLALGGDIHTFHVTVGEDLGEADVWQLLDRLYEGGYEIKNVSLGSDRSGTDCTAVTIVADELVDTREGDA